MGRAYLLDLARDAAGDADVLRRPLRLLTRLPRLGRRGALLGQPLLGAAGAVVRGGAAGQQGALPRGPALDERAHAGEDRVRDLRQAAHVRLVPAPLAAARPDPRDGGGVPRRVRRLLAALLAVGARHEQRAEGGQRDEAHGQAGLDLLPQVLPRGVEGRHPLHRGDAQARHAHDGHDGHDDGQAEEGGETELLGGRDAHAPQEADGDGDDCMGR